MDSLDKELGELKSFIADLKTDRAAQKEKEKREAWTKYTSMSLVFIAVIAAIATQWSGKYSGRVLVELNNSTFNQALASDQWNYFQANSIKLNLVETLRDSTVSKEETTTNSDADKQADDYAKKVAKYSTQKDKASSDAKDFEAKRDKSRAIAAESSRHGGQMNLAVSVFQIAIAIGSICLVTKKRWLWYVSLAMAFGATIKMIIVWLN